MSYEKTKNMLNTLKGRLQESEKKRLRELEELHELTRAIQLIQAQSEELTKIPELIRANSVLTCKVETARAALNLLKEGNARFLSTTVEEIGEGAKRVMPHPLQLHFGQRPHAVLVTCSDSRVPPELVFDQGLGDLFVVRIAGNAVDTLARASLIYGLEHLGAPLVVVMGHENCGAVTAALMADEELQNEPADIKALIQNIRGGLRTIVETTTSEEQVMCGVVCHVHHTVKALRSHPDIANLAAKKGVMIVGAYYAFNGCVTFFDEENSLLSPSVSGSNSGHFFRSTSM